MPKSKRGAKSTGTPSMSMSQNNPYPLIRGLFRSSLIFLLSCNYTMHRINEAALQCKRGPSYHKMYECIEAAVAAEGPFDQRHTITKAIRNAQRMSTTEEQARRAMKDFFRLLRDMVAAEAASNEEIAAAVVGVVAVATVVAVTAVVVSESSSDGGRSSHVNCGSDYDCHYGNMCCKPLGALRGICAIPDVRDTKIRPDPSSYRAGDGSCSVY